MKLAIGGATGLVGAEVLRQALTSKAITSVVAIGRRPASAPEGLDPDGTKLVNVVLSDMKTYPEEERRKLEGVGACIWYVSSYVCVSCFWGRVQGSPQGFWEVENKWSIADSHSLSS